MLPRIIPRAKWNNVFDVGIWRLTYFISDVFGLIKRNLEMPHQKEQKKNVESSYFGMNYFKVG